MFIIWGTKQVRRRLGKGGAYCPICADLRLFKVTGIGTVGHLYWIPMGRAKIAVHELCCNECGSLVVNDSDDPTWFAASAIERYLETNDPAGPDISAHAQDLLRIRRTAESEDASAEDRIAALLLPLVALQYMVESKTESGTSQSITSLIALALIVLVIADAVVLLGGGGAPSMSSPNPGPSPVTVSVLLSLTAVTLFTLIWRGVTGKSRIIEKVILTRIARSYDLLAPNIEEIDAVLAMATEAIIPTVRSLTTDRVLLALEEFREQQRQADG